MTVYHQILEEAPRTLVPEKMPEEMIKNSKRLKNLEIVSLFQALNRFTGSKILILAT